MLDILKYPDSRLKEVSTPIVSFDGELHRLLDEMAETMYAANGVGLAAPQVGKTYRAFIVDIRTEENVSGRLYEFINPTLSKGEGKVSFEEGCLSLPGISESVERKAKITVDYWDRFGNSQSLVAEDLLAVAVQHETDHLDGLLFVDRLSPLKRRLMKKKLSKVVTL